MVGGGLGKVGWVVSAWVRSVGLSWAGFVELSSVGWVPESGVRGHHSIKGHISPLKKKNVTKKNVTKLSVTKLNVTKMFSTGNISPNYSVTIDFTPPRPRDPYEAFLCDDLHRAHYSTSSHVEAISHPATLRGQKQDVYSKTVKSSCSPATQGSTITGRCRRFEGRVRSQSLELTRGEENHPCSSYSYRKNAASIMDYRVPPVAL